MGKQKRKKITAGNKFYSEFKLQESYTSLILGAVVVLVIGILFVFLAKGNKNTQTSSIKQEPGTEQSSNKANTSSTYTVKPGDDLWSISENFYNDGYKWVEIAKVNKIENPGLIHVGNKLTIPTISTISQKESVATKLKISPEATATMIENNSITENNYIVKPSDNLWNISVRAYGDGYKWSEIAKVNNIANPDLIYPNNVLNLPR